MSLEAALMQYVIVSYSQMKRVTIVRLGLGSCIDIR